MKSSAIVLTLALFACAPREAADSTPAAEPPLKVGLLTPGSINDGGWNAIAWEGLQRIRNEMGAEVAHQETKTPAEFEEGFRSFGERRFALAFGHGFEFQDAALAAGKLYPETVFITTSGTSVAENVAPMVFELEKATYLAGIVAARESKSGIAGVVGGIRLPSIESTFTAFRAGAQSVNPQFQVREVFTGNFDDVGAAKLATLSLINAGADFIFHQANEAGRGVFQACSERKVRCFGSNKDQASMAPDVVVASAVLDVPRAFVHMATLVRDGRFEPKIQYLGMQEGIVALVWNPRLKPEMSPDTIAEVERVEKAIREGTVQVPRGF